MEVERIEQAIGVIEAELRTLDAGIQDPGRARRLLELFSRGERVFAGAVAAVARRVGDPRVVAREAGTSVGKARAIVSLSRQLSVTPELRSAVREGAVSLDQATEIAKAEAAVPGCASELVSVAKTEPFHVLKTKVRETMLEEARHDLGECQRRARRASHRVTDLGLVHIEADLEPQVGAPIVESLEAEARRRSQSDDPWSARLADAFAACFGSDDADGSRAEVVVVVSHEVAERGWGGIEDGEVCRISGVGPIGPQVAKEIAENAFITGVVSDGKDLRQMRRWTRSIPVEVRLALRLGTPPEFDGPRCIDCGNRLRLEIDHVIPLAEGGSTSLANLKLRCEDCHEKKTREDRARMRRRKLAGAGAGSEAPPRDPP
jgi:hypothetical protein